MIYNKPIYLTSDVHLGAISEEAQSSFLEWLTWSAIDAEQIIINGDLFDFWFEFRNGIPSGYKIPLSVMKSVVLSGVPITLVGGNHDWWAGDYLREEIGIVIKPGPSVVDLAGKRTFLAHGDGLGSGDRFYKIARGILRSRLFVSLFSLLEPEQGTWIGNKISRTKQRGHRPSAQEHHRSELLKEWACATLRQENDWDLILLGHTHVPCFSQLGKGRYYINAGDWIYHRTFVTITQEDRPSLYCWKNGEPSPFLVK